jgi:hypothetical protein
VQEYAEPAIKAPSKATLHREVVKHPCATQVLYTAVLGLHFERQQQKKRGQLAIF